MMSRKCLVVDPMHESLFPMLEAMGWQVDYHPGITRSEIREKHRGYDGLIIRSKTMVNHDLLGEEPTLRFVGRAGAGIDNLDLQYLASKNIHVLHAAEGNRDAVGEFTVGIILGLLRNIPRAHQEVINGIWLRESNRGSEIMGKTIGIIGFGNMGHAFAKRLTGFGCKILVYDKYKHGFTNEFWQEADMDQIFAETEILSLHIPLTDETRGLVSAKRLELMPEGGTVLNFARAAIVDEQAVVSSLRAGRLGAYVCDFPSATTRGVAGVIALPHLGASTSEAEENCAMMVADTLRDFLEHGNIRHSVNFPEAALPRVPATSRTRRPAPAYPGG